ncbi:MAG TPA: hypothetical protein VJ925_04000 [Longimicrobiales bacterium]|nr:hypothetical protein [Longimicrobiales bacterium]
MKCGMPTTDSGHGWRRESGEFLDDDLNEYAIRGALPDAAALPELLDRVRSRFEHLARPKG